MADASTLVASSRNGAAPYSYISAGSANQDSQAVKAVAGHLYSVQLFNTAASVRYVRLYDKATGPTSADTPVGRFLLPAGGGVSVTLPVGMAFLNGVGFRITTGPTDADTGAASASDVLVNYTYC